MQIQKEYDNCLVFCWKLRLPSICNKLFLQKVRKKTKLKSAFSGYTCTNYNSRITMSIEVNHIYM